jgi:hypothetical protein
MRYLWALTAANIFIWLLKEEVVVIAMGDVI